MGNGIGKLNLCFSGAGEISRRHDIAVILSNPLDEGLGHSFCYIRPDPSRLSSSKVHSEYSTTTTIQTTTFRSISGASVSANTSTPLSTSLIDLYHYNSFDRASAFESSTSFASIPLQPVPKYSNYSSTLSGSGPIERGFLSGPIERGFASGPIERGLYSGPIEKGCDQLHRSFSFSHGGSGFKPKSQKHGLMRTFKKAIANKICRGRKSIVAPIKGVVSVKESDWAGGLEKNYENVPVSSTNLSGQVSLNCDDDEDNISMETQNLQWAQGKAGEDRMHIVVSEEHGWVFVGIYDGFNGPDAPDFLLSNLYPAVRKELKGLLWNDKFESTTTSVSTVSSTDSNSEDVSFPDEDFDQTCMNNSCSHCFGLESYPPGSGNSNLKTNSKQTMCQNSTNRISGAEKKWEESQRRWKGEWDRERLELHRKLKEQLNRSGSDGVVGVNHSDILKALSLALKKTEESYLDIADKMVMENPELALMGSCVLVMLMKGEDVYLMNVGDSRVVLARKAEHDLWIGKARQDLKRISKETLRDLEASDCYELDRVPSLASLQLTMDHSTDVEEEVRRIKSDHQDDASAVMNDRVKGSLKVTRAFGAGFLKEPKFNNALLEMFRIDYIGTSPYITCFPSLYHHRLGPRDRFLILSSDGLYQYFTNEEAVSEVELFIASSPEGDPAQHLIEEVLFRAAKKAGMDFHELLDIPQGDRRRYHDDVSIIIISLEGRIWRSSM